jgi:hypothetical protein
MRALAINRFEIWAGCSHPDRMHAIEEMKNLFSR